jgi:hypothetical protein
MHSHRHRASRPERPTREGHHQPYVGRSGVLGSLGYDLRFAASVVSGAVRGR